MAVSDVTANLGQKLQQGFEKRQPKTQVNIASTNTTAALQSVATGRADIAVIGRPLTAAEWRQGLVAQTIGRQKIAIIISATNPFTGTLSNEQFAQIWRGEIRNWSALGGPDRTIRLLDQTADSETRSALANYPVFQAAVAKPGPSVVPLKNDRIDTILAQLSNDAIAYVVVDPARVRSDLRSDIKMVPIHGALPDDPRYSFSQPLSYVYKGPNPTAAAKAFLSYASSADGIKLAQVSTATANTTTAKTTQSLAEATPSGAQKAAPAPSNASTEIAPIEQRGDWTVPVSWLSWLLLLVGVPLLGWWLKAKRRTAEHQANTSRSQLQSGTTPIDMPPSLPLPSSNTLNTLGTAATAPTVTPVVGIRAATLGVAGIVAQSLPSRVILVPRDCQNAYAYWEINEKQSAKLQENGGQALRLRLYSTSPWQGRALVQEHECLPTEPDCQIPIALDNYDYYVELGYVTASGQWLKLATSAPVRVPACDRATPVAAGSIADSPSSQVQPIPLPQALSAPKGRMILVARGALSVYAYWEMPPHQFLDSPDKQLQLRLYDVTSMTTDQDNLPLSYQQFDCPLTARDMHLAIPAQGRDYVAEVGYVNAIGQWMVLARSPHTHIDHDLPSRPHA
jgi:phosphate transport system substrate-binding protein